jgi:hypothetical protein
MKIGDKVICIRDLKNWQYKLNNTYTIVDMRIRKHNIMEDGSVKILESVIIEGEHKFKQDFVFERVWTGDLCFHKFFISLKDIRRQKLKKLNENR